MTDPKPVQESAPPAPAPGGTVRELAGLLSTLDFCPATNHPDCCLPMAEQVLRLFGPPQPEAEAPRPPAAPSLETVKCAHPGCGTMVPVEWSSGLCTPHWRWAREEPPRGAAAGEELDDPTRDQREAALEILSNGEGFSRNDLAEILAFAMWNRENSAREEGRKAGLEEAAREVERCGFNGEKAATESAEAIRALGTKGEGGE